MARSTTELIVRFLFALGIAVAVLLYVTPDTFGGVAIHAREFNSNTYNIDYSLPPAVINTVVDACDSTPSIHAQNWTDSNGTNSIKEAPFRVSADSLISFQVDERTYHLPLNNYSHQHIKDRARLLCAIHKETMSPEFSDREENCVTPIADHISTIVKTKSNYQIELLFATPLENTRYEVEFDLSLHGIGEVASAICLSKADELNAKGIDVSSCYPAVDRAITVFAPAERRDVEVELV